MSSLENKIKSFYNQEHYTIKLYDINGRTPLFDESIDATFIITLKESTERHKLMTEELNKYIPTSKIFIVYGQSYKQVSKSLNNQYISYSYEDLLKSNLIIFDIADKLLYKKILILEDDFVFSDRLQNPLIIENFNLFLNTTHLDLYTMGSMPFIIKEDYGYHFKIEDFYSMVSVVYTINYRKQIKNMVKNQKYPYKLDIEGLTNYVPGIKYIHRYPLVMQSFPETENYQHWLTNMTPGYYIEVLFYRVMIKLQNLDKRDDQLQKKWEQNYDNIIRNTYITYSLLHGVILGLITCFIVTFLLKMTKIS
jgi:hypothetical protein